MLRLIGTFFTLAATVIAGTGPSALYNALNGQTFNPPGYTIVMYQSCMQNQNAGNPCGSFSTFESSNGLYTNQLYGPATASGNCARTFRLSFACGPTVSMSGVNENPTCVYAATLTHPYVCGLDMTVGNEAASVSPTPLPPTATASTTLTLTATTSSTGTGTMTGTTTGTATTTLTLTATPTITSSTSTTLAPSATSTPLFVVTAFPTSTSTMTLTATSTPLYMITAWPTPSPVNVSATSTPLYYMTAYPSYNPNNESGLLGGLIASAPSSVATILGGVAVGIAGLGAIGFAVNYFKKGGTLKGLLQIAKSKEAEMTAMLPSSMKAKVEQAKADPRLQTALQIAEDPSKAVQTLTSALPPSVQQLAQTLPPQLTQVLPPQLTSVLPPQLTQVTQVLNNHPAYSDIPFETPVLQQVVTAVSNSAPVVEPLAPQMATLEVSAEQVEAIQAFLASKKLTSAS